MGFCLSIESDCEQQAFAVRAEYVRDLASSLREQIEAFFRNASPNLMEMDEVEVADHHLELIEERNDLYPHTDVRLASWRAIYKSEARPGNLRAVVDFISHRGRRRIGGSVRPAQVLCFLYRSQAAANSNQWVARITWSEKDHPSAPATWIDKPPVDVALNRSALEVLRFVNTRTATAEEFAESLRQLARRADLLTSRVLLSGSNDLWPPDAVEELRALEAEWEATPYAPTQLHHASKFFDAFLRALETHRWAIQDQYEATPTTRERWTQQELEKLIGFFRAVDLLIDQAQGSFAVTPFYVFQP